MNIGQQLLNRAGVKTRTDELPLHSFCVGHRQHLPLTFDFPEDQVTGVQWMGKGPYRVWKNRMMGAEFGVWQKDYNDAITGVSWEYPEFKVFMQMSTGPPFKQNKLLSRWFSLQMICSCTALHLSAQSFMQRLNKALPDNITCCHGLGNGMRKQSSFILETICPNREKRLRKSIAVRAILYNCLRSFSLNVFSKGYENPVAAVLVAIFRKYLNEW